MVAIEQLYQIFSKVADNVQKRVEPPQQKTVKNPPLYLRKCVQIWPNLLPQYIPISLKDEGTCSTSVQHKLHMSHSGPNSILPEVPVPPPRVQTAQPPMVDTEGPSSNLRSRGKKTPISHFVLTAQSQKTHEANAVTHKISGVAQKYRHLVKVPDRKI